MQSVLYRPEGEPFKSTDLVVDLAHLPKNIRDLIISTAKLAVSHALGKKLKAQKSDLKDKDGKVLANPPVFIGDRFISLVESHKETPKPEVKLEDSAAPAQPS